MQVESVNLMTIGELFKSVRPWPCGFIFFSWFEHLWKMRFQMYSYHLNLVYYLHIFHLQNYNFTVTFRMRKEESIFHYRIMIQTGCTVKNKTPRLHLNLESWFQSLSIHHGVCTYQCKQLLLESIGWKV